MSPTRVEDPTRQASGEVSGPPGVTRVTVNLPAKAVEELRRIAERDNITMTQALRNAIALQNYVTGEIEEGGKLLVEKPNGRLREVVLR